MSLLNRLYKIANHFDYLGLLKEADLLDYLMRKLAMDFNEARSVLEVSPNATPEEIQNAWKQKIRIWHTDVNKSPEAEEMSKKINVARDLLLGEREPERIPEEPKPYGEQPFRTKQPPRTENKVSFEEAAQTAGVPEGVNWKFKTDTLHGTYIGDVEVAGFVIYGTTDESHVFVGVYHHREQNFFSNRDIDTYEMWVRQVPKTANLADIASAVIRELWNNFTHVKSYNAKVSILPDGLPFNHSIQWAKGRSISFKDAMGLLGNTPTTWTPGKKVDVIIELGYPPKGGHILDYLVTLVINGRPHQLSEESSNMVSKMRKLLTAIFGTYYYADSRKNITRQPADKRKVILEFLAKHLEGKEPEELITALKMAAEQAK